MKFKDYYAVLGIEPDADDKTVKAAYKKLARKYHPDVSKHPQAEEKFKEIGEAYEVLHSSKERAQYDELRRHYLHGGAQQADFGSDFRQGRQYSDAQVDQEFTDFINSLFGGTHGGFHHQRQAHHGRPQKGQDVELEFPLFLEETLIDTVKPIEFQLPQRDAHGRVQHSTKSLKVTIPAGVANGERIRLKGQGGKAPAGGENGDLYLHIRYAPHPLFDVDGHNLSIVVPITPWEAALGCKVAVPTLSGKIQLSIPPNSQAGQRLRIKGKGLQGKKAQGDLFAILKVVLPTSSDEASQKLWQQLASANSFNPRANWSN